MKITKVGHCCLVLEIDGATIVTDPGSFTEKQNGEIAGVDAVVFTHEHADHYHLDSLKALLKNNHGVVVIGNSAMHKLLAAEGISCTEVGDGGSTVIKGVKIEGFGKDHALVYPPDTGLCENTGFFIDDRFYFPGDSFHVPGRAVDVLALPVAGPWMKISEAVDFAKTIKARVALGVHDGIVQPFFRGYVGNLMKRFVPETEFVSLQDGESREF